MIKLNDFTCCPIGMTLYSSEIGECKVVKHEDSKIIVESIPFVECIIYTRVYYTQGGHSIINGPQVLFFSKPSFVTMPLLSDDQMKQIMDIKYPNLKMDDPILVRFKNDQNWCHRHFAGKFQNNKIGVWVNGQTSWSAKEISNSEIAYFEVWKLPNE